MTQYDGFSRKNNKDFQEIPLPHKPMNKPKNAENSLKIYTNNFFFPDFPNFYPKNLFFKSPNITSFTTTKKLQNALNPNNQTQSPNNFFNRLRKNHSISNIASPLNSILQPNTRKIYDKARGKFMPFRRSSINNVANKSLNNANISDKLRPNKSISKHNLSEDKNFESGHDNAKFRSKINDCKMNSKELINIFQELIKYDNNSNNITHFAEKIEQEFINKTSEINKLELRLKEKEEKIQRIESEKKDLQNSINNLRKSKNDAKKPRNDIQQDLVEENMKIKEKILEQQGKIMEFKKQEKKFMDFLNDLKEKGVDLEQIYEEKQIKKQKKELKKKKILEEMIISPKLIDLESDTHYADESIVNDSGESSFNYYGKPPISENDSCEYKFKEKVKIPKGKKKKLKFKINLNLKEIKNPQLEKKSQSD